MKSVIMSFQPYYVFLIIARFMGWDIPQEKTIEVRKDFPKDKAWNNRTLIYCSKNRKSFNRIPEQYKPLMSKLLGKVIGEFVCDRILSLDNQRAIQASEYGDYSVWDADSERWVDWCIDETCISTVDLIKYLGGKDAYFWHITDLKIYGRTKELAEFRKPLELVKCGFFNLIGCNPVCSYFATENSCNTYQDWRKGICPPQSWRYCEA